MQDANPVNDGREDSRGSPPPNPSHRPRLADYKITKGTFSEIAHTAREGMLETFKAQPGFIRYGLADTGEGRCLSISLWETHA